MKKTPHVHSEVIHAFADGAQVQCLNAHGVWIDLRFPDFDPKEKYRIKPSAPETRMKSYELSAAFDANKMLIVALEDVANAAIARALEDGDVMLPESRTERDMTIAKTVYDICKNAMENHFLLGTTFQPDFQGIIASIKP